jgi:sugar phosphate isomerase/epimerase
MDRLAIEFICTFGMPPVEYIRLAAELGVHKIGIACAPIVANPYGYPAWNLAEDAALLRQTKAALRERGVSISLGEGFLIMPGIAIADAAAKMDTLAEIGTPIVNVVLIEPDHARAIDQFGQFAAMAAQHGMAATIEFMPISPTRDIHAALDIITGSGAANGKVLVDAMHFFRSGSVAADLVGIDPNSIGYAQICDVPMPALTTDYGSEARDERRLPGDGDLPLLDLIRALPASVTIGLEVPMKSRAETGIAPADLLRPGIAACRKLLREAE